MAYAYNTFEAWLQGHGLGSSLDGTGELKDGTSQAFFSSQYAAWLNDLIDHYADAIRTTYGLAPDYQFAFALNPNDPAGLPAISGLTAAQVDQLFGDTSDFSWTSGGKINLVTHTRYYSNSFDFSQLNHAPTADPAEAGGAEDAASIAITLTGSDADAGDAVESFALTSLPPAMAGVLYTDAAGLNPAVTGLAYTATGEALTLYFVPAGNFNGPAQFTFTASDGELASTATTATITVTQVNDAAVFDGNTSGSGEEDGGPIVGTLTVSADADGMTAPKFRIETGDGASHGTASIDSITGQWSYAPDADFNGADHFTVSVTDDDGNAETQVVDIAVSPAVDPTVAHDDEFTGTEDAGVTGNVLANDFNPDNETVVALSGVRDAASLPKIVITEIMANPATTSDADREWFEVYNAGAAPVDLNGWTIQIGGNSILVDSPTPLLVGPGGFFVFAANSNFVFPSNYTTGPLGLANDGTTIALFDPDGHEIDTVAYRPVNAPPADPPNTFPADVEGHSFYLSDPSADNNDGLLWETAPDTGHSYDSVNLGTPGTANPAFAGVTGIGDPPVVGQPAVFLSGALLTLNADGTFVFDSNHVYDFLAEGQSWIEQFTYTLSGGQTANVVLTIEGVNDAPVAHDDVYAVLEDVPFIAELPNASSVLSNDSDADTGAVLTASLVDSTSHGSLTFNADGTFIYVPDAEFSGTDHFTYRLNDGFVASNVATVEIQVIALNDAPVAHDDEATTDAHTAMSGNVLGNDTDVDGDALVVTAIAALAPGDVLPNIVISEIMDNPAGVPDSTGEWFEVFNAGPVPVDLNGWTIQIGSNTIVVDNPSPLVVPSGGYFVFAANGDPTLNASALAVGFGYVTGPLGLVDSGIAITLFDAEGHEIDRVDTSAILLPPEGHSFFLLDASSDNSLGASWETSGGNQTYSPQNFGTPGQGGLGGSGPIAEIGEPVMLASGALLTLNADGTFDYDPNGAFDHLAEGETATDGFAYTVSDGSGGVDTASVTITIDGVPANDNGSMDSAILVSPASLTVSGGNTTPIYGQVFEAGLTESPGAASTIVAQLGYGAAGTEPAGNQGWIWVDALFNAQSGNNDEYVATFDSVPLTVGTYAYTYRFGVSVNGQAPLDWTYADLDGSGNGVTLDQLGVMTVETGGGGVNHAPVAVDDSADVTVVDFEVEGFAPGVLANDSDPDGDGLDVVAFNGDATHLGDLITLPSGARFAMYSDGAYNYIADAPLFFHLALGDSYVDTITYTIRDTHGSSSDGTLTITVHGVSPGPVAGDDIAATDEDTPLFVSALSDSILANDVDFDGQGVLVVAAVNGSEAAVGHQITLASGALLTVFGGGGYFYDPNGKFDFLQSGESTTDSFDYTAANSAGIWSTATVTITIGGLDEAPPPPADPHAPVAVDDFAQVFVDFEVEGFAPGVLANDSDPDGGDIEVVAINGDNAHLGDIITLPSGAHFQMFSDGAYDYIADAPWFSDFLDGGQSFIDTISYTIRDTTGATDTATLSITVTAPIESPGAIDFALLQFPATVSVPAGGTEQVYGRVFEAGLTPQAGASPTIVAQFGYGAVGTDPQFDDSWVWENATFDSQITNDDLYVASIPDDLAPDLYAYTFRFGISNGGQIPAAWTYGDLDGSTNGLSIDQLGALLVV